VVEPIHPKAMPVILTTYEKRELEGWYRRSVFMGNRVRSRHLIPVSQGEMS
jgi:hypothetical protein